MLNMFSKSVIAYDTQILLFYLAKKGLISSVDVLNVLDYVLSFNHIACHCSFGPHH